MDTRLIWLALGTFAVGVEGFVIATLLPAIAADSGVTITQAGYLPMRSERRCSRRSRGGSTAGRCWR